MRRYPVIVSSRLEQQNGYLPQVEIDKMLCFVCHVRSKVSSDDAVPRWIILFVEFLLNVRGDVFLDIKFLHCLRGAVDCLLLHIFRHVGILDNRLAIGHLQAQPTLIRI